MIQRTAPFPLSWSTRIIRRKDPDAAVGPDRALEGADPAPGAEVLVDLHDAAEWHAFSLSGVFTFLAVTTVADAAMPPH